jgi:hypothetical protein
MQARERKIFAMGKPSTLSLFGLRRFIRTTLIALPSKQIAAYTAIGNVAVIRNE